MRLTFNISSFVKIINIVFSSIIVNVSLNRSRLNIGAKFARFGVLQSQLNTSVVVIDDNENSAVVRCPKRGHNGFVFVFRYSGSIDAYRAGRQEFAEVCHRVELSLSIVLMLSRVYNNGWVDEVADPSWATLSVEYHIPVRPSDSMVKQVLYI